MTPTEAEFIEIHNPTSAAINLSNVYLSDSDLYYSITVNGTPTIGTTDFVVRFPDGASIPAGGYQTISTGQPSTWSPFYAGACPTYFLPSGVVIVPRPSGKASLNSPTYFVPLAIVLTPWPLGFPFLNSPT